MIKDRFDLVIILLQSLLKSLLVVRDATLTFDEPLLCGK